MRIGSATPSNPRRRSVGRATPAERTYGLTTIGSDPTLDACQLIDLVLGQESGSVSALELHERSGWLARRFNPALAILLSQVDEGRVSRACDGKYAASYFLLVAEDRVSLKRFASQVRR